MSQSAPPDWYPDVSAPGLERWWDGERWSAVTRPAVSQQSAPAGVEQSHPGSPYPAWTPATGPRSVPYRRPVPTTADGVPLAGLAARLGARLVDLAVITVIGLAIGAPSVRRVWIASSAWQARWEVKLAAGQTPDYNDVVKDPAFADPLVVLMLILLLVSAVYTIGFIAVRGATPGKLLAGIRVRPADQEGRPTFLQALLRWLMLEGFSQFPWIGSLYLLIDALSPLFNRHRQALHDRSARTVVVSGRFPTRR